MIDIRLSSICLVHAVRVVLLVLILQVGQAETAPAISNVFVSKAVFNPNLQQTADVSFTIRYSGLVDVVILDRDGYIVRTLCSNKKTNAGELKFVWDGKNDSGEIVPNEAYSLKVDLKAQPKSESYFPANRVPEDLQAQVSYYDRQNGVFSYSLPKPSRVHIQAGSAVIDPVTKKPIGPVMKTIVNREPRSGGSIIEQWNGYDESSTIYIPELPNFATAIAATALPVNSIVTIGNNRTAFLDTVYKRKGNSLFTFSVKDHHHHRGLSALDDVSPALVLKHLNAIWDPGQRLWKISDSNLRIQAGLNGPSADNFSKQPGKLEVFLDGRSVQSIPPAGTDFSISLSLTKIPAGTHIVALNWGSDYGPTTVNSFRILVHEPSNGKESTKFQEKQ